MTVTVVAELGINHQGSLDQALAMVWSAAQAGADAVKVQHFSAAEFCTPAAEYQGERQIDLFKRYELTYGQLGRIAEECARCKVGFFGTPDSLHHGEQLVELGAQWIKVGSDDLVNLPLLLALSGLGKPMIISTGMASAEEITEALAIIPRLDVTVMHCVSCYPTPPEWANLARLESLRRLCPGYRVGYSDHTDGIEAAVLSVAAGAVMVEKHFTLNRAMPGPDHAFSADPVQFTDMVRHIRQAETLMGGGKVDPGAEEMNMRKVARRSIVAVKHIRKWSEIRSHDLACRRPGTGLMPKRMVDIVGRQATRDIEPDEQLRAGDWA